MYRLVGILYCLSGAWCALNIDESAAFLGFGLSDDAARIEFFAVYGGLQIGLGVAIILTSLMSKYIQASVFFAAVFSTILFLFRSIAMLLYSSEIYLMGLLLLEGGIALVLWIYWFLYTRRARDLSNSETHG